MRIRIRRRSSPRFISVERNTEGFVSKIFVFFVETCRTDHEVDTGEGQARNFISGLRRPRLPHMGILSVQPCDSGFRSVISSVTRDGVSQGVYQDPFKNSSAVERERGGERKGLPFFSIQASNPQLGGVLNRRSRSKPPPHDVSQSQMHAERRRAAVSRAEGLMAHPLHPHRTIAPTQRSRQRCCLRALLWRIPAQLPPVP